MYSHPDATDLERAILELRDPELRRTCGQRGQAAVRDMYNWERDTERLLQGLKQTVNGARHR